MKIAMIMETLGLVILEAMVSGLPVVAVRSGPTEEQVEDGVKEFFSRQIMQRV